MNNTTTGKIIIISLLSMLSILGVVSFAADPSFSISVNSGTQLKLHCNYTMGIIINPGGVSYNGFDSTLKFDNTNVAINHLSINAFFNSTTSGFIKDGYLYRAYGVSPGSSSSSTLQAATFGFKTTQNILSTMIEFTTLAGNAIVFDKNTTADGAVINSSSSSLDTLSGVTDATYTFIPLPCIVDNEVPTINSNTPINGARYIATGYQVGFLVYDWIGPGNVAGTLPMGTNNRSHYRYAGGATTLGNYQAAPSTVDNQEGVNSGSIKVTVSCPSCVGSWTHVLTQANLNSTPWAGNGSINASTRDSADRGYNVNFDAPAPYEIEKLVTVNIQATDNPNENGNVHTGTYSFSFNAPSAPIITRLNPAASINVATTISPIIFRMTDDWAGVDPATIQITIPAIMSGATQLYTGYTYSGSDLSLVLTGGAVGLGNSGAYQVSLVPKRAFPSNTIITITGSVYDYANNLGSYADTFLTSKSCADWGCSDVFTLNILGGTNIGSYTFTGSLIIITGTNLASPYPYLTGENNDIIMCGLPYSGTILTGNIGIYDTTGTLINGASYSNDQLYITGENGLDFVYSNGVIIIQ